MLALPAFLIFILASAKLLGQRLAISQMVELALTSLPPEIAALIQNAVNDMLARPALGFFTASLAVSLWISSGLLDSLRQGLNKAYSVQIKTNYLLLRFQAMWITMILGALIIVLSMLLLYAPLARHAVEQSVGTDLGWLLALDGWRLIIAFVVVFLTSLSAHLFLPHHRPPVSVLMVGTFVNTAMWFILMGMFTYNLRHVGGIGNIYGALTSIVAVMLFFYLSALIFLFGAYLNAEMATHWHKHYRRAHASYKALRHKPLG